MSVIKVAAPSGGEIGVGRAVLAGCCASLVGIGIARFAYTPLLPAVIAAGWFSPGEAAYLGAANLAGYLLGALLGRNLGRWLPPAVALRGAMLVTVFSLGACALPVSFLWFFGWRLVSGITGCVLIVMAAPTILPLVPAHRRGLAGGIIFTGVGIGIAASGSLVPPLLHYGLTRCWLGLAALSLLLTALAWSGWPDTRRIALPVGRDAGTASPRPLQTLYFGYGLNAFGLVPAMVFLVDFIARGLGHGIVAGAHYWVLFGIGAILGPMLAGALGDKIGFRRALVLAYAVQAGLVAAFLVARSPVGLGAASLALGAFPPGVVVLALGRVHELVPAYGHGRQAAWAWCTVAFALGQAGGAYGLAFLFSRDASYQHLFVAGALAFLLALAVELVVGRVRR